MDKEEARWDELPTEVLMDIFSYLQATPEADTPVCLLLLQGLTPEQLPLLRFLLDHGASLDIPTAEVNPLNAFLR